MPEAVPEQIAEAIVTRLAGIVGDAGTSFWLTPSKVVRRFAPTEECLDSSLETIYVLSPDGKEEQEESTGAILAHMRLTLACFYRFDPQTEQPFEPSLPHRWTWQERMGRDVRKKIREDVTLGGLCLNCEITESDESSENTWLEKWAMVLLRMLVTYSYVRGTP